MYFKVKGVRRWEAREWNADQALGHNSWVQIPAPSWALNTSLKLPEPLYLYNACLMVLFGIRLYKIFKRVGHIVSTQSMGLLTSVKAVSLKY